mgnify:CR=1 FL=1
MLLLGGVAVALALRTAIGGSDAASSQAAALVFAAGMLALAAAAGFRRRRVRHAHLGIGAAAGALLVAAWVMASPGRSVLQPQATPAVLAAWSLLVCAVAIAEEVVLRGVLFTSLTSVAGPGIALAVSSAAFALLHVPLYGWQAVPVDLAVGFMLGGLRLLTGGIAASATAHAIADLATGWIA